MILLFCVASLNGLVWKVQDSFILKSDALPRMTRKLGSVSTEFNDKQQSLRRACFQVWRCCATKDNQRTNYENDEQPQTGSVLLCSAGHAASQTNAQDKDFFGSMGRVSKGFQR